MPTRADALVALSWRAMTDADETRVSSNVNACAFASGHERRLLVLYGSETGNAQDVAERIVREAKLRHYAPVLMPMESYDVRALPNERYVVLVTSTTGQGDEPRNMKSFWRFLLRRSLSATSLTKVSYSVFGLGDSGYQKYNVAAKKLFRRLEGLGAIAICGLGLGDDQHPLGYEAALNPWLTDLWRSMRELVALPSHLNDPNDDETATAPLPSSRFIVEVDESSTAEVPKESEAEFERVCAAHRALQFAIAAADACDANMMLSKKYFEDRERSKRIDYNGIVHTNKCLTSEDAVKAVHHLEFKLTDGSTTEYEAGDVLGVIPFATSTDDAKLLKLIKRMGLSPTALVRVFPASIRADQRSEFPWVELKYLIASGIDIDSSSPRRYFFEVMSRFAEVDHEKERLQYFASAEGAADLYKYNQRERRTVCEIFDDFPSLKPTIEWFLQVSPHLKPRYYSISSSPEDTLRTGTTHITVAMAEWITPMKRKRRGLCSSWLISLKEGAKVAFSISKGSITLPPTDVPLILVGPGTGIAPFRSFVRTRLAQSGGEKGDTFVVFGCRNSRHDYLYKEEWQNIVEQGSLCGSKALGAFVVAFSRDSVEGRKEYVQDRIQDEAKRVWSLLESGAKVFVAGSAEKMPADVRNAIQRVVRTEGSLSEEESARYMSKLDTSGRYFVDAW